MRPVPITFLIMAVSTVSTTVHGKTAEQIFAEVSPAVVMVYGISDESVAQGSGVVVGHSQVVTNCHVLRNQGVFRVTTDNRAHVYEATLQYADEPHDICQLLVNGLSTKPVSIGTSKSVRVGQKVYAIGSPRGLERTLSDGLISSIRPTKEGYSYLQITTPITRGSSGGGLFNEEGQLIAITTSGIEDGQNLNFALPIDLLANLTARRDNKEFIDSVTSAARDHVRPALVRSAPDSSPQKPVFSDDGHRIMYQNWLGAMSSRLKQTIPDSDTRIRLLQTVWYEAKRAGLEPAFVLGVVKVESNFKQLHVAPNGALGYMGVMPKWTKIVGDGDSRKLFHTQANLRYGCALIRMNLDQENGNLFLALGRYKNKRGFSEYPNAVLSAWKEFE